MARRCTPARGFTPVRPATAPAAQRGFTYLWLLFILAAGAAGLAAIGQRASTAVQRDREAELMFRGHEIARALAAYWLATPGAARSLPTSLQELLEDRRGTLPLRHLRRVYADPFTGQPDWRLVTTDDDKISGVRSRANVVALRSLDLPNPWSGSRALVSDRVFMATLTAAAGASGAPSVSAGASAAGRGGKPDDRSATEGQDETPHRASE